MTEDKNNLLGRYKPAFNEDLNKEHSIKEFSGKTNRHGVFTVYTDGSALSASECKDRKSFAGWGFFFKDEFSNGRSNEGSKYGNLFNSDSEAAEIKALLEALKFNNHPSHFEVVSDCSSVVLGLRDIHLKIADYHNLTSKMKDERLSPKELNKYNYLKLWKEVHNEITQNENIVSLKIRWVRAHSLSKKEEKELPNPNNFKEKGERRLVQDILGNNKADYFARLGSIKAIRSALFFYNNTVDYNKPLSEIKNKNLERSISTCAKNFKSKFSSDEAIKFLSNQPNNFIHKEIYNKIFSSSTRKKIAEIKRSKSNNYKKTIKNNVSKKNHLAELKFEEKHKIIDSKYGEMSSSI